MTIKGKALVWLHKCDEGKYGHEHTINLQSCNGEDTYWVHEDIEACVSMDEPWRHMLQRMKPGDWVRFTIKWELIYSSWLDHYSGATEHDVDCDVTVVKVLRRGHYKERYEAKPQVAIRPTESSNSGQNSGATSVQHGLRHPSLCA